MEAAPRADQIGRSLTELDFRRRYNVSVIVVRQLVPDEILVAPDGDFVVKDSDILVLLGRNEDLEALQTE
jgi:trk system potassium uptake protein TrkA